MTAVWVSDVIDFWFGELQRSDWFGKDARLDDRISSRFRETYEHLTRRPPAELASDAETALAAILVLDQFPRNMFRGTPQAFATDALARQVADSAITNGLDGAIDRSRRIFLYLPFEHSETAADQQRAIELISELGDDEFTRYAEAHAEVVRRFGRFPHRNAVLGRTSSMDEKAYLAEPGSGF